MNGDVVVKDPATLATDFSDDNEYTVTLPLPHTAVCSYWRMLTILYQLLLCYLGNTNTIYQEVDINGMD